MLAATVWPTSTLREITRPSIGALITVCSRFTWFWLSRGFGLRDRRLHLGDGGLLRLDRGLGRVDGRLGGVEIALRQKAPRGQFLGARVLLLRVDQLNATPVEVALGLGEVRVRLRQVGPRLLGLGFEQRRVEAREHLTLLHERVEVGAEERDVPGYLAADLHGGHRLERAGRSDGFDDVAARDCDVVTVGGVGFLEYR